MLDINLTLHIRFIVFVAQVSNLGYEDWTPALLWMFQGAGGRKIISTKE